MHDKGSNLRPNGDEKIGICLGLQCAAIEFARNVCGIKGADSTEFCKDLKDEQQVSSIFIIYFRKKLLFVRLLLICQNMQVRAFKH